MLIDYKGQRLVAMTQLPLSRAHLVYGSKDAGRTVHNDIAEFSEHMAAAGQALHLAPHPVGGCLLHTAGDVEGHVDPDGNKYLLDLARTFPPESPAECKHLPPSGNSVFYRQLRPEFLQRLASSSRNRAVLPSTSANHSTATLSLLGARHLTRVTRRAGERR